MRLLGLLFAVLAPFQAQALSCVEPDVAWFYETLDARPEHYVLAYGTFEGDGTVLNNTRRQTSRTYRFTGYSGTKAGLTHPLDAPVMVTFMRLDQGRTVNGGKMLKGRPALVFLERRRDSYFLRVDLCGGAVFYDPTPSDLSQATNCLAGRRCVPYED